MTTQDLRLEAALDELAALITRSTAGLDDGLHPTALRGLQLSRVTVSLPRVHGLSSPCVGLVAQGTKRIILGDEVYDYNRSHFIAGSVDLPVASQVIGASPAKPFLALKFELEQREVAELLVEVPALAAPAETAPARGIFVTRVNPDLAEAFVRLLRLLDSPEDIPALEAGARREVLYRILKSEQGGRLRELAGLSGRSPRIAKAIQWLRQNFHRPLRVEELAALANMSTSSFHEHFRSMTAMSPLQFQKQLRLHEARQLLMSEALDAATAGHRVGYESPSQFSREYSRLFGVPPATDMKRLRGAATGPGARSMQAAAPA
jgi:AraC-like DNA-binding protein